MTYKIKNGDTLSGIAKSYNTTVDAIASANGIKNKNLIFAGDTLTIPEGKAGGTSSAVSGGTVTLTGGGDIPVTAYKVGSSTAQTGKASADVDKWRASRPASYKDTYASAISSLLASLAGRKFSYDPKSDPAYSAMRDRYLSDARLAMEDAAGDASGKTGGFSNSYAQSVGNQAYGKTMGDFADILPELYEAAYDRYSDDGDDMEARLKLLSTLSGDEWDRYNDSIKNYLTEGKMLEDFYSDLSKEDTESYLKYLAMMNK